MSTKKQLETVHLKDTNIEVIMPENVYNQINYLCNKIAKVEWSGILFYKVAGSIKNPESMVITLVDILPMNKGTQAYTEYSFGPEVVEYMMENEHLEDCKMGHIHSHNTMGVFFSGTDMSELEDNSPNHNFYLSLIVNNFMEFCARVAFITSCEETIQFPFYAKDEQGVKYLHSSEGFVAPNKKMIMHDCDIKSPSNSIFVEDAFKGKVNHIIEKANRVIPISKTYQTHGTHKPEVRGFKSWNAFDEDEEPQFTSEKTKGKWQRKQESERTENKEEFPINKTRNVTIEKKIGYMMFNVEAYDDVIVAFAMCLLNAGNPTGTFGNIDDIAEFYLSNKVTPKTLGKKVFNNYTSIYNKFFKDLEVRNDDVVSLDILTAVISHFEESYMVCKDDTIRDVYEQVVDALKVLEEEFEDLMNLSKQNFKL